MDITVSIPLYHISILGEPYKCSGKFCHLCMVTYSPVFILNDLETYVARTWASSQTSISSKLILLTELQLVL